MRACIALWLSACCSDCYSSWCLDQRSSLLHVLHDSSYCDCVSSTLPGTRCPPGIAGGPWVSGASHW